MRRFQHTAARRRLGKLQFQTACHLTFQHTAARRRLAAVTSPMPFKFCSFNTQPPEGGWQPSLLQCRLSFVVSTHSRPKAAGLYSRKARVMVFSVSTHSRPKAAGRRRSGGSRDAVGFNTQPPEGGWVVCVFQLADLISFNTQPPEGGWGVFAALFVIAIVFQHTAARRRLAFPALETRAIRLFQHTAARRRLANVYVGGALLAYVSTHSRPKAAGTVNATIEASVSRFQHTAARRRLDGVDSSVLSAYRVSTHSRPKAAGY